ncbi:TetR/AcrR family transcriptional regulator [Amycolatopsis sp. cmx-4-68]|uniref:TetR/AcrR family transcriptional regulator n=1 Tax=Amycolatopsis sp. cmx-4-68 TaxID=2790938 RepID=UPI00397A9EA2
MPADGGVEEVHGRRADVATRRRIVEAAADEIRERGTTVTTLDDVGRRSGTGKSQLFHYFPGGREQLLLAVAELEAERVFDDQQPYLSELASRAAWDAWRDLLVEQYRGEADPAFDPETTAAAVIAAVQGGVTVLLSTGSAAHLEAALDLCLDHLLS